MKRPEKNDGKRKDEPPGLASSVIVGGAAILCKLSTRVSRAWSFLRDTLDPALAQLLSGLL